MYLHILGDVKKKDAHFKGWGAPKKRESHEIVTLNANERRNVRRKAKITDAEQCQSMNETERK